MIDMTKDLMGKSVLVVSHRDREIGKLTEVSDEWIKLVCQYKKTTTISIIKTATIIRISELPY